MRFKADEIVSVLQSEIEQYKAKLDVREVGRVTIAAPQGEAGLLSAAIGFVGGWALLTLIVGIARTLFGCLLTAHCGLQRRIGFVGFGGLLGQRKIQNGRHLRMQCSLFCFPFAFASRVAW